MVWAALGKAAMGGLKAGAKKVATNKLLNRKKKRPKKRTSGKEMSENMMNKDNVEQKKGGALAVQPSAGLVPTAGDLSPVSTSSGESDVIIIKKQLIQVRDILKDTRTAKQAERKNLRKARQSDKRKKGEDKLEKPKVAGAPKAAKSGIKMPSLGLGIGNFLTALIAGLIFNKLKDLMPALKKIMGVLKGVAGFIVGVLEKTLGFVVGFIDLSYAGVEKLEEGIEAIGGKGAKKLFNKFGKLFTQIVNAGMIAALLATRVGLFRPRNPRNPRNRRGPRSRRPTPNWKKALQRKWKTSGVGKFVRNQRAGFLKVTRRVSQGPVGRAFKALRPKNIGNFIRSGGVDKALKGGVKNVTNFVTQNKTIQNLTKKIKPLKTIQNVTQRINPFKGMDMGKTASNLMARGKQFGGKILEGAKGLRARLGKNILTLFKQGTNLGRKIGQGFTNLTDKVNPQKVIKNLRAALKGQLDQLLKKNKFVKQIYNMVTKKGAAKKTIQNLIKKAGNFKPLKKLITTLSKSKATKGLGPVEKIITALSAIIDYAGGESPLNAVLKAMGGLLGYTAGFAAASAVPVLGQSGIFNFA